MRYLRSVLLVFIVVMLGAVFTFVQQPEEATAQSNRQVWAFYMGFWNGGSAWDMQANVLSDYPLIGKYDSRDGGVAGAHIDQAKSAGIDAFIVSWFGTEDGYVTNPALNNMLDRAAERGFKVGVAVDMFNGDFGRDRVVNALRHTMGNLIHRPAYLRYDGKPVIFFAFQGASGFSTATWQAIRNEVDPGRSTIWLAEGLSGCCLYGGAMDGMYAFNMAWNNGRSARYISERNAITSRGGKYYIPTIHPGWDEAKIAQRDHRPNPTSPRGRAGGQFLTNTWNGAVAAGTDVILVVSWNEFMENSHIEPSVLYGTQSLDVLRNLIPAWKAGGAAAPPPGGSPTGQYVEARQYVINVRSGPGTSHAVIGQIRPGTQYQIVSESGDWWAIAYGGQTGYVFKPLVTVSGGGPVTTPGGQSVEAYWIANVRAGPGTNYDAIGQIRHGTRYPIAGESGGWWIITFNGQNGYVSKSVVRVVAGTS